MKKQFSVAALGLMLTLFMIVGCGKDDAPTPPPSKTELLTLSPWTMLSANASGTDVTNHAMLACFKDNIISFSALGSFNVNESTLVCAPSTAGTFTWNFQSNESQLVLSAPLFPGGTGTFTLVSITETNLTVSQNVTIPPAVTPIPVTFVFKH